MTPWAAYIQAVAQGRIAPLPEPNIQDKLRQWERAEDEALETKAEVCLYIARLELGPNTPAEVLEEAAFQMMSWPDEQIREELNNRLKAQR